MAITFLQQPKVFTPSDNEIEWLVSSNQFLQPNFEYKIELYIDGVLSSVDKLFPKPNGVVKYNATELVKTTYDIPTINTDIAVNADLLESTDTLKEVYIVVTEVYGNPPAEEGTGTSSTINVWKASLSDLDYIDFNPTNYTLTGTGKSALTYPNDWKYWVDIEKSNYLVFYNETQRTIDVRLETFDATGASIDTETITFGDQPKDVYIANVSLKEYDINTTDALYYQVRIVPFLTSVVNAPIVKTYYINRPCVKDRTVYFFNKLGGIDSCIFNKQKQSFRDFTRQRYSRALTTIDTSTGEDILLSKFRGRDVNYSNSSSNRITLMSDWLPQDQITWLVQEMLESPLIWMEDENDNKIAYHITNASEEEPQEKYEGLSQIVIELASSFKSKSVLF